MFTEIFGDSPRVKLLDFLADHVDYDYTISQLQEFTGVSRPTIYGLIEELVAERMLAPTREVGGSRFFRLNTRNENVVAMLRLDFDAINRSVLDAAGPPARVASGNPTRRVGRGGTRYAAHGPPRVSAAGVTNARKRAKKRAKGHPG